MKTVRHFSLFFKTYLYYYVILLFIFSLFHFYEIVFFSWVIVSDRKLDFFILTSMSQVWARFRCLSNENVYNLVVYEMTTLFTVRKAHFVDTHFHTVYYFHVSRITPVWKRAAPRIILVCERELLECHNSKNE